MGSGSQRRISDHVPIVPQKRGGVGGGASGNEKWLICPSSFRVPLKDGLPIGAALDLRKEGENLRVHLFGKEVARLNKKQSETISTCMSYGYRYGGVVKKEKNGRLYGELKRTI
jgi:hypothetical protein